MMKKKLVIIKLMKHLKPMNFHRLMKHLNPMKFYRLMKHLKLMKCQQSTVCRARNQTLNKRKETSRSIWCIDSPSPS
jgi:hypothetical protein